MNKKDFEFVKKMLEVKDDSVREACLIVKEYLSNKEENSAVDSEEFLKSVKVLLNHSYETSNKNTMVETYYCKEDCRNNECYGFCPGEFQIDNNGKKLCKHYLNPKQKV